MKSLLDKIRLKNINFNNRLVMPPMATSKSCEDGNITEDLISYYDEKTNGGYIGLVIIEHSYISIEGKASKNQISIDQNADIYNLEVLANTIRKNGSKSCIQLNHAGSAAFKQENIKVVGPSKIIHPSRNTIPEELSKEEIKEIVNKFVKSAIMAKDAGFDSIEIHSAHGYLLNQFYSPLTNKRNDEYGGSLLNRIRIHLEIIESIKNKLGDYPIFLRLGGSDYMSEGSTIENSVFAALEFEKAGIDILDISGGFLGYQNPYKDDRYGYFSENTKILKQNLNIPVILTGGITTKVQADDLINSDCADLIGVGRAILQNSNWCKEQLNN